MSNCLKNQSPKFHLGICILPHLEKSKINLNPIDNAPSLDIAPWMLSAPTVRFDWTKLEKDPTNSETYSSIYSLLSGITIMLLQEFFEHIERERAKDFEILARKYHAIGPLLTKMEGLVVHTNTGKSPKLHQYYTYWEKKVYQSLTKVNMVLNGFFSAYKS